MRIKQPTELVQTAAAGPCAACPTLTLVTKSVVALGGPESKLTFLVSSRAYGQNVNMGVPLQPDICPLRLQLTACKQTGQVVHLTRLAAHDPLGTPPILAGGSPFPPR